jgi:L-2-hydroxyglutarate oxidase LhgO
MKARWPALIAMPNDFVGFFAHHAGVVRAHVGLMACKQLALEQGADLRYNQNVKSVDIKGGIVELENGQKLRGKNVVISCGPFTEQFYAPGTFDAKKLPQETYVINNNKDLPPTMIISGVPEFGGYDIYALWDGENLNQYKFGYEKGSGDSTQTLALLKKFFPTKY